MAKPTSINHCAFLKFPVIGIGVFVLCLGCLQAQDTKDKEEWIQLFNGRDLSGWHPKINGHRLDDNFGNTFRVENGVLKVSYDHYSDFGQKFGHIFYKKSYSYYRLRLQYRFVGEQVAGGPNWAFKNSGIMLHCQSPESMGKDQNFPISIEVQLLGGPGSGERTTANLCTPGTNVVMEDRLVTKHCISSTSKTYHDDQWIDAEVVVLGASNVKHIINGETVLAYQLPQIGGGSVAGHDPTVKEDGELLEAGYISLQSESHPVEFRKIELLNLVGCLDPESSNYKSYFVKADNSLCRDR